MNGHWIKSQRTVKFPLEGLDPLRYTVQNGNGRGCSPQSPDSIVTQESQSTTEPMEVVSRGGDSPSNQEVSPSGRSSVECEGGDMGRREGEMMCKLEGNTDGVEVTDRMEEGEGEVEESSKRDRSAHIVGEPMEEGQHAASSAGSHSAESADSAIHAALDPSDLPKLYNLFAISVSSSIHIILFVHMINFLIPTFLDHTHNSVTRES